MTTPSNLILTTEGFALRQELAELATAKSAKVLRHEHPPVHRVRLHVKHEAPHHAAPCFLARATAEHAGPDHVAHATGAEPEIAIHAALAKLERLLSDAIASRRHDRRGAVTAHGFSA